MFQSTRPQGARPNSITPRSPAWRFQSTRPQGARRGVGRNSTIRFLVSIHAPAGGATACPPLVRAVGGVSIHAPAGGATHKSVAKNLPKRVSIHAPAGGATLWPLVAIPAAATFQSTRPQGARRTQSMPCLFFCMFQSTRPQGARHGNIAGAHRQRNVSIHAPAGGATGISLPTTV